MKHLISLLLLSSTYSQPATAAQSWTGKCNFLKESFVANSKHLNTVFSPNPGFMAPPREAKWKELNWGGMAVPIPAGKISRQVVDSDSFQLTTEDKFFLLVSKSNESPDTIDTHQLRYSTTLKDLHCDEKENIAQQKIAEILILKNLALPGTLIAVYKDLNHLKSVTEIMKIKSQRISWRTTVLKEKQLWEFYYMFPSEEAFKKFEANLLRLGLPIEERNQAPQQLQDLFEKL
jgi:hypothetical protein